MSRMNRMHRISVLVATGALGAVALTGCSSSASKSAGNGASSPVSSTSSAASTSAATTGSSGPGGSQSSGSASTSASSPAGSTSTGGPSNDAAPTSAGSHTKGGACTSAEMPSGTWRDVQGSEGAGHVAADIAFQNTSGHSCTVSGFPDIALQASNNNSLPSRVVKDESVSVTTITVAPGAWVHSEIRYSADIPGPGEPGSGQCEPTTVHALGQLPGDSAWVRVTLDRPTPVCEKGEMQAKPFMSGQSSPAGG